VAAIIDHQAVTELDHFFDLLGDRRIQKVIHAGRQDLEIFSVLSGSVPAPIFDTQVAAAMVGYGTQVGYAQLVQQIVGVALDKSETFTNWAQRPLTPQQIAYALEDVRYLFSLHDHLHDKLKTLGRLEWEEEEFRRLQGLADEETRNPRLRYQRIKGWEGLHPRARGVLREIAAWREHEAKRRDRPRGRILRDEILVEIARRAPATIEALGALRGVQPSHVEKYGQTLVAAVQQGLAAKEHDLPKVEKRKRIDPETAGLADLLGTALKVRAVEASIAPVAGHVARPGDVRPASRERAGRAAAPPAGLAAHARRRAPPQGPFRPAHRRLRPRNGAGPPVRKIRAGPVAE